MTEAYNENMCGRFVFSNVKSLEKRFSADTSQIPLFKASYNIAPGQFVPVIARNSPKKAQLMKWGLIPFWAKDAKIGYRMINARAETVAIKASFRKSFKNKRCLVPADGFYEWKKSDKGKSPFFIHLQDDSTFAFAGLYDEWAGPDGKTIQTFTIITTTPNKLVAKIHDRMPVILKRGSEDAWLSPTEDLAKVVKLLVPYPIDKMQAYRVTTKVNSPVNNSPDLIDPVNNI